MEEIAFEDSWLIIRQHFVSYVPPLIILSSGGGYIPRAYLLGFNLQLWAFDSSLSTQSLESSLGNNFGPGMSYETTNGINFTTLDFSEPNFTALSGCQGPSGRA